MISRAGKPDTPSDILIRECIDSAPPLSFNMVAGAGSGKTTSLVKALEYIRATYGHALRANNQRVACITYTEIATQEISKDVGNDQLFHVSTIHSFLWELIVPFQNDIKQWVQKEIETKIHELTENQGNYSSKVQQSTKDKDTRKMQILVKQQRLLQSVPGFKYGTGSEYGKGILGHADILKLVPDLIEQSALLRTITARKYPFFFVDESQDTVASVIEALRKIYQQESDQFCLGFFGDPMQKIYVSGVGEILQEPEWKVIQKEENFRSPEKVLSAINNIRANADKLKQSQGRKGSGSQEGHGSAQLIVFPTDGRRSQHLKTARQWAANTLEDPLWLVDGKDSDLKILVIVHRMAAKRLGFETLYSAFNDGSPSSFKDSFTEGTHWALAPFCNYLLPLTQAFLGSDSFSMMCLLRDNCPLLGKKAIAETKDVPKLLSQLKEKIESLSQMLSSESDKTVQETLEFASNERLLQLDERFLMGPPEASDDPEEGPKWEKAMGAYSACPVQELWGYQKYMNEESPFATHQGIKGAEYERVLVVLDDEEGKAHKHFSYEKLLGIKKLSSKDKENIANHIDSAFERTLRLFYVCCSRALKDLIVVLFTHDVEAAVTAIKKTRIFSDSSVLSFREL